MTFAEVIRAAIPGATEDVVDRVGSVWTYGNRGEASWEVWLGKYGTDGTCPTLLAAKAALAEAVGEWVKRAGLMAGPIVERLPPFIFDEDTPHD